MKTQIASASDDCNVILWSAKHSSRKNTEAPALASTSFSSSDLNGRNSNCVILKGHADWVTCVAFSRDDLQLISGCDDFTMILWDVKSKLVCY